MLVPQLFAQKMAVLVQGISKFDNPSFPRFFEKEDDLVRLNQTKFRETFFPGIEVRLNPRGRVAFGVGYQRWVLEQPPRHYSNPWWVDPTKEFNRYDISGEVTAKVLVGTLYVNFSKNSIVQPFVGIGGGYSQLKLIKRLYNAWQNIDIFSPEEKKIILDSGMTLDQYQNPPMEIWTQEKKKYILKGVGGFNVYPIKHLVFSFDGGYVNGPTASFSVGLSF